MNNLMTPEMDSRVNEMLESAKADLEKFRNELGKDMVSVHDRYTQLKKELLEAIRQMKAMIDENKALAKEVADTLREKLSTLEAEVTKQSEKLSESDLVKQLVTIKEAMAEIVGYLGSIPVYDLSLSRIHDRIYRYKIKLAILKLKIQLGTLKVKDVVLDAKFDLKRKAHDFRTYAERSEENLGKRWKVFQHEITEAYEHLQKAFTSK